MFLLVYEKIWKDKEGFVDNVESSPYCVNMAFCRKLYVVKQSRKFKDDSFIDVLLSCYSVVANFEGQSEDIVMGAFTTENDAINYMKSLTSLYNKNFNR